MSYNGSGTFNINTAGQPVVTGTTITSTAFNLLTADLASGLTTALTKDGQTTPTANIPMGTFKITGLGAGSAATDAAQYGQLQAGATTIATVSGTDTLTGTLSPAPTAYATGNLFSFVAVATNTGAATINLNSLGAKSITKSGVTALAAGDIVSGQLYLIEYDGTRFQLINPSTLTVSSISFGSTGLTPATATTGAVTVAGTLAIANGGTGTTSTTFANLTTNVTGTLPVANGGTGAASFTANNVLLGNGTSALQVVAPGTTGNVLTSNGTTWTSAASGGSLTGTTDSATPFETALGYQAGNVNTGIRNTFLGYQSGLANSTGTRNTISGYKAFAAVTTGSRNTVTGSEAMETASSGDDNCAFGYAALTNTSSRSFNTAVGSGAFYLYDKSRGTAVGYGAGYYSAGDDNSYFGYQAGYNHTGSGSSTYIGRNAGFGVYGSGGAVAGTACGAYALQAETGGNYNSAFGASSGTAITTGSSNTTLGTRSGNAITTGSGNVVVGTLDNAGGINPAFSITTENNRISMGSTAVTNAYIQVAWTAVSDARDKTDFAPVPHGLAFVTQLQPTAYRYKPKRESTVGHGPIRYGFKAQEVLALEGSNPVIVDAEDSEKLRFNDQSMIAVLVKALQELNAKFDAYVVAHP